MTADEMKRTKARASFAILSIDQMDNDTILEMIDKSPTYNRTPQFKSQLEKAMEKK
jgi:cell division protein FtsZ